MDTNHRRGIDGLLPLDWLPADVTLTTHTGAHGDKAEDSCAMAISLLNARLPQLLALTQSRLEPIYTTPLPASLSSSSAR